MTGDEVLFAALVGYIVMVDQKLSRKIVFVCFPRVTKIYLVIIKFKLDIINSFTGGPFGQTHKGKIFNIPSPFLMRFGMIIN